MTIGHYDEEFWSDPLHDEREEARTIHAEHSYWDERDREEEEFNQHILDEEEEGEEEVPEHWNDDPVIIKATPDEAGCWIAGHHGWRAHVELIRIAQSHGAVLTTEDEYHVERYEHGGPRGGVAGSADYLLNQGGLCDWAEAWLNSHVAPEGFLFGWDDGEFFLRPIEDENECQECHNPATQFGMDGSRWCDEHAECSCDDD